ncbi:hypothetical protein J437_LFUL006606 [Ladona fulva]|uniref:Uncharacterized protein n=1 Tax=Ladona fulva TaxID=123851 RepID=A0A8K0KGF2_LADFU|nr:hypothetical protein J437_LFUL006606 [Ladona fulva]
MDLDSSICRSIMFNRHTLFKSVYLEIHSICNTGGTNTCLIPELYSIKFIGMLQEFWTEGGGDELSIVRQFMDHEGTELWRQNSWFLHHNNAPPHLVNCLTCLIWPPLTSPNQRDHSKERDFSR